MSDRNGSGCDRPTRRTLNLLCLIAMEFPNVVVGHSVPRNKGKLTGQKPPLKLGEIWASRTRLQMASNIRELVMFNLAIDSKLRACHLTRLQVQDVRHGSHVASNGMLLKVGSCFTNTIAACVMASACVSHRIGLLRSSRVGGWEGSMVVPFAAAQHCPTRPRRTAIATGVLSGYVPIRQHRIKHFKVASLGQIEL